MCWNRCKIQTTTGEEYPMIYAFNFALSGAYKDKVLDSMTDACCEVIQQQEIKKYNILNKVKKHYKDKLDLIEGKDEKLTYATRNKPDSFHDTFDHGTPHGLQKARRNAQKLSLGHVHYKNSEFLDGYSDKDANVDQILSMAKEAWSLGDTSSSMIAGEWRENVKAVPFTFLLHGSSAGLKENKFIFNKFSKILETGIAKRSIVLFDDKHKRVKRTYEERLEDEDLVKQYLPEMKNHMTKMYQAIKCHSESFVDGAPDFLTSTIKVSAKAKIRMHQYENNCIDTADKSKNEIIRIETQDRFWRALRLAACVSLVEHPDNLEITKSDYEFAIILIERWGNQFRDFLYGGKKTDTHKLYDYILDNPGMSKTDIKGFLNARFAKEVEEAIGSVMEYADENNMMFLIEQGRGLAKYYKLEPVPQHKEVESDVEVVFSQADKNIAKETKYVPDSCYFDDLHKRIKENRGYSAALFKDNYRKGANWMQGDNLLIFDIDNDDEELKINNCVELVSKYKCMIITTKSHRIDKKNHGVKDRYRVVFPTNEIKGISSDDYKLIKERIMKDLGFYNYADKGASKDPARFFFGHDGKHWYSDSKLMLNWKVYNYKEEEKKTEYKNLVPIGYNKIDSSTRVVLSNSKSISAEEAKIDAISKNGKTTPCCCINPGHKDKHASAFYSMTKDNNFLIYCSGCNTKHII